MNKGRIVASGSPQDIASRYGTGRRLTIRGYSRSRLLASLANSSNTLGDTLTLSMDRLDSMLIAEIVDMAIKDGLEVQFKNPSLEDAFLRLVGRIDEDGRLIING
jgi:ABC-type multidrug transport system ATPase subunit